MCALDRDQSYVPSETEIEDAEAEEKEEGHETDVAEEVGPEPKAKPKPVKVNKAIHLSYCNRYTCSS